MFTAIRRKLHAGRNAHGFCLARPDGQLGVHRRSGGTGVSLTRAETLATQEFLGHDTVAISVQTKAELRQTIQESLGIISDLGEGAAIRFKDLSLRISAPRSAPITAPSLPPPGPRSRRRRPRRTFL